MGAYWPTATAGEGTNSIVRAHHILTRASPCRSIVVWDIKTGVIVRDIVINVEGRLDRIVFSGHYAVTLFTYPCGVICTYDALDGTLLYKGEILPRFDRRLDGHWEHEESLWFATSYATDGKRAIDIHRLQPSSIPQFSTIESFVVPLHDGISSFSPVSFHASFVTDTEITVLDVRDSKILLRVEAPRRLEYESGCFSPDGDFFACGLKGDGIRVWKNTSAGYTTWTNLQSRSRFEWFSFSPTGISILAWGGDFGGLGVELLDNHTNILSPNTITPDSGYGYYLMAHSKDGTRIATAWRGGNFITVADPVSDAPERSINTEMEIMDVGIVGNTVFATDLREVVGWDLEVGEIVHRALGVVVEIADLKCESSRSWVTFTVHGIIFLYGFQGQSLYHRYTVDHDVMDIRFTPDGCQLCFITQTNFPEATDPQSCTVEPFMGWSQKLTEDLWSDDESSLFEGYHISPWSMWIEDDGDRKLLWLPPSWRDYRWEGAWNGNFMVLVIESPQVPIIIAFQPQPLSPSPSIQSLDT